MKVTQLSPTLWNLMDCSPPVSSVYELSRQEYWVSCHFLLQGIFPTQGLNPGLLHRRWILYHLSHQGSPYLIKTCIYFKILWNFQFHAHVVNSKRNPETFQFLWTHFLNHVFSLSYPLCFLKSLVAVPTSLSNLLNQHFQLELSQICFFIILYILPTVTVIL